MHTAEGVGYRLGRVPRTRAKRWPRVLTRIALAVGADVWLDSSARLADARGRDRLAVLGPSRWKWRRARSALTATRGIKI